MRLGPLIYDVKGIADLYGLDVAEMCWPVLLTSKKGGHALCLCANWGQPGHTALTSKAHVKPKAWNINPPSGTIQSGSQSGNALQQRQRHRLLRHSHRDLAYLLRSPALEDRMLILPTTVVSIKEDGGF